MVESGYDQETLLYLQPNRLNQAIADLCPSWTAAVRENNPGSPTDEGPRSNIL